MSQQQTFLETLQQYYDHGLLKEVYATDNVIVCNAFNQMYIAFIPEIMDTYTDKFPGFAMNVLGLKSIIKDDHYAVTYYTNLSEKAREDVLFILQEDFFQHLLANKERFDRRPPSSDVDLQFEQDLKEKGADAIRAELLAQKPTKRGFFRFFKKK